MLSQIVRQLKVGANRQFPKALLSNLSYVHRYEFVLVFIRSQLLLFRACDALRSCLPDMLRDGTFSGCLHVRTIINFHSF